VGGITEVKEEDRLALRELWRSQIVEENEEENEEDAFDPFFWLHLDHWTHNENDILLSKKKKGGIAKEGAEIGIMCRLNKVFLLHASMMGWLIQVPFPGL
jgi:hypothetical protein